MKSPVLLESYLKALRLPVFLKEYAQAARQCGEGGGEYEEYLEALSRREISVREGKAMARRLAQAGFPSAKEISDFDFSSAPSLNKTKVLGLSDCSFVRRMENVVITGPPGVGKTHLAIAMGREACRRGLKVRFFTAAALVNIYLEAREERQVLRLESSLRKQDMIVLDELGYIPFSQAGSQHLFGFFSQCYEQTSVVLTTNLPFSEWPQLFGGDERLAGALLDRLTHKVHILDIQGDSYRLRASLKRREGGDAAKAKEAAKGKDAAIEKTED